MVGRYTYKGSAHLARFVNAGEAKSVELIADLQVAFRVWWMCGHMAVALSTLTFKKNNLLQNIFFF